MYEPLRLPALSAASLPVGRQGRPAWAMRWQAGPLASNGLNLLLGTGYLNKSKFVWDLVCYRIFLRYLRSPFFPDSIMNYAW